MAAAILFLQLVHARFAAPAAAKLSFGSAALTFDGIPLRFSPL